MKLIGFQIYNWKAIIVVEMEMTDKGLTIVKGKNEQGKSSLIMALEFLLRGKASATSDIVHHGADESIVKGTFATKDGSSFTVERTLSAEGKMGLKIINDGKKQQRPQEFLNSLINELTFDPKPFVNKDDREKVKFLLKLLKIDVEGIDKEIKVAYDQRRHRSTEIHRIGKPECPGDLTDFDPNKVPNINDIRKEEAVLMKAWQEQVKEIRVANAAAIMEATQIDAAQKEVKHEYERVQYKLEGFMMKVKDLTMKKEDVDQGYAKIAEEIEHYEQLAINARKRHADKELEIIRINNELIEAKEMVAKGKAKLAIVPKPTETAIIAQQLPEPLFDNTVIERKITDAQIAIENRERFREYQKRSKEYMTMEQEHAQLEEAINDLRKRKEILLSSVPMPEPGLEFKLDDDLNATLWYKGIFSENWSESQAMRISATLCSRMSPELRCLFIDRGESYDRDSLKTLNEWAVSNDLQAIITIVGEPIDGENAIYIEEGVVKS
jgi:AAA15 family ATPase/GTPase